MKGELSEEEKEVLNKAAQPYGETLSLSPVERKEKMIRLIMRAFDKNYDEAVRIERMFKKKSDMKQGNKNKYNIGGKLCIKYQLLKTKKQKRWMNGMASQ